MRTLQTEYNTILEPFAKLFSERIWEHAKVLLIGAILSPAERTVTAALRVMGLSSEKHFQNYHRVLNRAVWSSLEASHILLDLLVNAFASSGPIILGLDDTIERRRGAKIKARGIYTCTSTQVQVSRSSTFEPQSFCESQWAALVEPGVAGSYSMGATSMGITVSHSACAVRTIL